MALMTSPALVAGETVLGAAGNSEDGGEVRTVSISSSACCRCCWSRLMAGLCLGSAIGIMAEKW